MALTDSIPDLGVSAKGVFTVVGWFILIIVLAIITAVVTYMILINKKRYTKQIVIFERIGASWEVSRKDRAMEQALGNAGDFVFILKKHKHKCLPRPTIQTGRNTYWYAIREDGEWINIGIEDIDVKSRKLGARFLDKEMRYNRTAIQKMMKERFDKPGFWQKYGGIVAYTALIGITGIMVYLSFDKFLDIANAVNANIEISSMVMDKADKIIGTLDNLCSTSGLR